MAATPRTSGRTPKDNPNYARQPGRQTTAENRRTAAATASPTTAAASPAASRRGSSGEQGGASRRLSSRSLTPTTAAEKAAKSAVAPPPMDTVGSTMEDRVALIEAKLVQVEEEKMKMRKDLEALEEAS